jgi:hypothetical protein
MNEYDPTNPHETSAASEPSGAGSTGGADAAPPAPPESSPDSSAPVTMAERARWPKVRRYLSHGKSRWIAAAAMMCAVVGLSVGFAVSPSATAGQSASGGGFAGAGPASGGGGTNARSGPASGGASGTVGSTSTSSFTLSTAAGQKVTVDEASSTTYEKGTSAIAASALTTGEPVVVLGTTNGMTITATQVIVQPNDGGGSAASSAAGVVPFQRGAPTTAKQVGQIPANFSEGAGTIVSGTAANKATEAALAAYPGGVVDRVVQLSNGEYNVHFIGVNWPHHAFVNQDFKVVGAE